VLTRRWWPKLVHDMEIAQIGITPAQLATFAALGTLVSMAALALVAPLLAAFGLAVPLVARSVVSRKLRRVRIAFDDQLPDALQVLASALRAGHSFVGSLAVV